MKKGYRCTVHGTWYDVHVATFDINKPAGEAGGEGGIDDKPPSTNLTAASNTLLCCSAVATSSVPPNPDKDPAPKHEPHLAASKAFAQSHDAIPEAALKPFVDCKNADDIAMPSHTVTLLNKNGPGDKDKIGACHYFYGYEAVKAVDAARGVPVTSVEVPLSDISKTASRTLRVASNEMYALRLGEKKYGCAVHAKNYEVHLSKMMEVVEVGGKVLLRTPSYIYSYRTACPKSSVDQSTSRCS